MVVCDVSFISIRLALPPALVLAAAGALAVILVKPQFEVGRDAVGKGGIVDPKLAEETATSFREWLDAQPGWRSVGLVESPVLGGDGNREFLLGGVKDR
jgi:23S rRNA (cytidine1920-2'-O)/16S rRNA (cytidine1409-2'-O)-methyltransferase